MKPIIRGLAVAGVLAVVAVFIWLRYGSNLTYDHITPPTQSLDQLSANGVPAFELKTLEGQPFKFARGEKALASSAVVLHFWASWCGPCVEEFPSLVKMAKLLGESVKVVAISADENVDNAKRFIKGQEALPPNFIVLVDESYKVAQLYGTEQIPESYILNSDLTLRKKLPNATEWTDASVISLLKSDAASPVKK